MKNNNKGLTLVELLVATAIFGLVSLGASFFMITGMRFFNDVNRNVRLQYDSQLVMNFIHEHLVDCQWGVAAHNNQELYLVNNDGNVHVISFQPVDGEPGKQTAHYALLESPDGNVPESLTLPTWNKTNLLAENITSVEIKVIYDNADTEGMYVSVTLEMERGNKSYQTTQVTALRNHPVVGTNWADLHDKLYPDAPAEGA